MAKSKKGIVKWTAIVLALLLIGGAVVYSSVTQAAPVNTAKVRKGTVRAYVEERARTTLPNIHHVSMPLDGRIEAITLREGDSVTNGQIVARLDADDLNDALKEAQEAVSAMANAVAASDAKIKASRARQDFAKWLWQAQQKLYSDQKASEMTVKEAERDFIESQVSTDQDQFVFHAMSAVSAATRLMPLYINRRLRRSVIVSPIDGAILRRYEHAEKVLSAGAPLLDIGNVAELEVTADILSDEVVRIKPGDPVDILGAAVGDKPLRGTVSRIKPEGFTKVSSLGVEEQRVAIIVAFDPDDLEALRAAGRDLGVEYRVRVRIYTATRDDTLWIPTTALFRGGDGDWEVFAVRNGKARLVKVKAGLANDTQTEILDGLFAGDEVILAPEASLTAGARVKPL